MQQIGSPRTEHPHQKTGRVQQDRTPLPCRLDTQRHTETHRDTQRAAGSGTTWTVADGPQTIPTPQYRVVLSSG